MDEFLPSSFAASWSIEIPSSMSPPSVLFAQTPVRNAADARVCAPPPSATVSTI